MKASRANGGMLLPWHHFHIPGIGHCGFLSEEVEWLYLDFDYVTLAVAWKSMSMEGT